MTEFKFDKWVELYAHRTASMKSSGIRDLLSVTARPDIISLAGGLPYTRLFRFEKVVEATEHAMQREGSAALQYGPSEGHKGLKKHIIKLMEEEGIKVDFDDILVTDGAQQALDLLSKIFINPGDKIIVEAPSYVGALNAFASYEANIVSIPLDKDGLQVDLLQETLEEFTKKGEVLKFIYLVPNFHNPAGVTLSLKRREHLLSLAREHGLIVVEDNAYGRLRFEGEDIKNLKAMDDSVIYVGTFSKIFSPGLRLGWVVAPKPILEKLIFAKQAADLCSSSFAQRVVEEYFTHNLWKRHIEKLVEIYRSRRDAMLQALEEFFPDEVRWTKPQGGFFVWVALPEYVDTTEMLAEAISEKVAYVPGRGFFADASGKNYMRLAFCYPEEEVIHEGIKRLSKVVKRYIILYKSVAKKLHL
ncbi:MAG: PLP-dependent aminotransferase family protein [Actinomycetota bacterium]|nr:PLP-dependent aminotransferase family protein [Actinomycetota bacterium]MDI6822326.1 PLP-dependent aminotransferase family protein [Actinomycetota bacterium]